jgi:vacuolar-type H+-ATPase subunit C/Vma6
VGRALSLYEKTGDPAAIDLEMDKEAMRSVARAIDRVGRRERQWLMWAMEWHLNSTVLEALLRGKQWGFEPGELRRAVEGIPCTVPGPVLGVIVESREIEEVARAMQLLEGRSIPRLSSHVGLVEMASELRERGWRSAVTRFRKLFLTSGSHPILAVGSLILLEEEVRNLAGICAGIELGLPKNKVLEALVF